mmetsp:Transcript_125072/g.221652  ORF Transcript_125072/g.221652 Transcript_125072/m.221652 type:complete len:349 (+) Transcript_125072:61-1107(+)
MVRSTGLRSRCWSDSAKPCWMEEDISYVDQAFTLCEAWVSHQKQISEIVPKLQAAAYILGHEVEKGSLLDLTASLHTLTTQILDVLSHMDEQVTRALGTSNQVIFSSPSWPALTLDKMSPISQVKARQQLIEAGSRSSSHTTMTGADSDQHLDDSPTLPASESDKPLPMQSDSDQVSESGVHRTIPVHLVNSVGSDSEAEGDIKPCSVVDFSEGSGYQDSQFAGAATAHVRPSDVVAIKSLSAPKAAAPAAMMTVVALDATSGELGEVMLEVPRMRPKVSDVKQALAQKYGEEHVANVQLVIRSNGTMVAHRDTDIIRSKRTFAVGLSLLDKIKRGDPELLDHVDDII